MRVTLIHTVGDAVLTNHASAAQHRALPDLDELVNPGLSADDHVVSNMNVAGKADVVGNDGVVSDDAVMGDMDIGHQQIAVSDNSYSLVLYGSYRECAVFANNVIVTDNQLSFLAAVFIILRIDTDRCKGINLGWFLPILVWPVRTIWLCKVVPSPTSTWGPIVQNGPTTTFSASLA